MEDWFKLSQDDIDKSVRNLIDHGSSIYSHREQAEQVIDYLRSLGVDVSYYNITSEVDDDRFIYEIHVSKIIRQTIKALLED